MLNIHPNFKLNNFNFSFSDDLLKYLEFQFPVDFRFLSELFNDENFITVQTSGSTGSPKSIQISKLALLKSAENTSRFFDIKSKSKVLHCLSSNFIAGKMMWVRALHLGWHITLVKPDSFPLLQTEIFFDFAAMVPLQAINSQNDLFRIKKLIIGGGQLSKKWQDSFALIPSEIFLTYGMTETITHIAAKKIGAPGGFRLLPQVKISTDQRNCLEVTLTYLGNNKIITNDLVKIINETEFEWLGRFDNIINSGGIKLIPETIEQKLQPFIPCEFFVAGIDDEKLGTKLILLVESNHQVFDLATKFQSACLEKYEIPKEIIHLSHFQRTENGKIDRFNTLKGINQL